MFPSPLRETSNARLSAREILKISAEQQSTRLIIGGDGGSSSAETEGTASYGYRSGKDWYLNKYVRCARYISREISRLVGR